MAQKPLDPEQLQAAVDAYAENGSQTKGAAALGIPVPTFKNRLLAANRKGYTPSAGLTEAPQIKADRERVRLEDEVRRLKAEIQDVRRHNITTGEVRETILGLAATPPSPPKWLVRKPRKKQSHGVPTLFCSDWHWGEVVAHEQVDGYNEFNLEIGHRRVRHLVDTTVLLAKHCLADWGTLPGIVVPLGGDMLSGDIHEELSETNEQPMMAAFLDLYGVLIWMLETLAEEFGKVFVPCVVGNHSRLTRKPRAKSRAYTSFDWLMYSLLDKHFATTKYDVTFLVSDGTDAYFRVYNHRYLLTHGDAIGAKGGDGMIGPLGPITRGDFKVRRVSAALGQEYDSLLIGHFHRHMTLRGMICNGSLKGWDEYAKVNRFPPELPIQSLHFTHPQWGPIWPNPIFLEDPVERKPAEWVSWQKPD